MFDFSRLVFRRAAVHVPEFAPLLKDGAQQAPEVVVRELTADERRDVVRSTIVRGEFAYYDMALVVYLGAVQGDLDDADKGKRLFRSVDQVRDLPGSYDAAILRLANEVLELSGLKERVETESTPLELEKKA